MFTSVIYVASNALYETTKEDIFLAQKDVFKAFSLLTSLACCVTIFVPLVALSDSALENYKVIKEEWSESSVKTIFPRSFKLVNFKLLQQ